MSYLSDLLKSISGNQYTQEDVDRHAALYDALVFNHYEGGVGNRLLDGYMPPQYAPEIPQASYSNEGRGGIGEAFAPAVKTYYGNEGRGVGVDQSQRRLADLANPANTISPPGFDPNFMRQSQPVAAATAEKPLPKNYIKNESTGKVIDLDYAAAPRQKDPWVDGAQVISRQPLSDGRFLVVERVPAMDGFGRQSTSTRERIEGETLAQQKTRAEIAKLQAEALPKVTKAEETSEQKNYRFAMSLPENMRQPFLEKLGMARKEEKEKQEKSLPTPAITKLMGVGDTTEASERTKAAFKPEYGNKTISGELSNWYGQLMGDDTGQVQWWQDFRTGQNQVRHALFGSALTATERSEWEKISINPRMDSGEIQKNLDRRAELERKAANKLARAYEAGGYNKEQIAELIPGYGVATPQKPSQEPTPQKPETKYVETRQTKAGLVGKKADGTLELIRK